jgi:hypothetical protein
MLVDISERKAAEEEKALLLRELERALIAQADMKLGLALAHASLRTVRQLEGERRNDSAHTIDEGVESRCGR